MKLALCEAPESYRAVTKFIEDVTQFKSLPFLTFNKNYISAINKIPASYKGVVFGDFDQDVVLRFQKQQATSSDVEYLCKIYKTFKTYRPNCKIVNLGFPSTPYYEDENTFKSYIDYYKDFGLGIPNWILWDYLDGGCFTTFNPYPERAIKQEQRFQSSKYKDKYKINLKILENSFPEKEKVVVFWHRQSAGKDKFKLLDFDELWSRHIEPFIGKDITLVWYGVLREIEFRQSDKYAKMFARNTKSEYKDAEVNFKDKDACERYYIKQFTNLVFKVHKKLQEVKKDN